uniref:cysteine--tRNA ligase n=1 Tax=Dermatophagoides pteronyssinus TaxID=6956 RepID=A0A6P6Y7B4_DERPT|nr:cysteine--tRNA ligase, cytoplasmic-like [Dermatophagoides pteronyssinus]
MQRKLQLLNSLSQKLEDFEPREGRALEWYVCGPTVYDVSHLGHARNYVATDAMRRILEDYFGYHVKQCMNITDVDDKILRRSAELGVEFEQLARFYEAEFFADLQGLNCRLPSVVTRVTEHLPQIVAYVEQIIANGFAYEAQGSVYFDVEADAAVRDEQVLTAARAQGKRSFRDFALWKRAGADEVGWSSPWGRGRPGWHIECSAMASYALQPVIDLHSGGVDLRFPHHDNEIAQCEAYFQSDEWVRYFLHVGHLNINGCKMSKSLKNFVSIQEMLKRHTFQEIRILHGRMVSEDAI